MKALEEHGIGRPSTYATIISTLKDREYVDMDNRRFIPTDIGKIVGSFLSKHFHKYVEYGFTASLEDELDAVSRGEENWTEPLKKFWKPFITQVEHIEKNVSREEVAQARELGKHPESGKPITVRMGRYGPFVQIGTKDDEEKPKFAGLRPGQKMDLIKLPEALELFKLPVKLGEHRRRRAGAGQHRPLRPVHQVRREVRLAEAAGRPVHGRARARARSHPSQEGSGRQSHHPGLRRRQHPGVERPLRPVHHRRQAQCAHPEGHGPEGDHARGLPRVAGRRAASWRVSLRPQEDAGSKDAAPAKDAAAATAEGAAVSKSKKKSATKSAQKSDGTDAVAAKAERKSTPAKKKSAARGNAKSASAVPKKTSPKPKKKESKT